MPWIEERKSKSVFYEWIREFPRKACPESKVPRGNFME